MNHIMSSIKGYSYARRQGGGYAGHLVRGGLIIIYLLHNCVCNILISYSVNVAINYFTVA